MPVRPKSLLGAEFTEKMRQRKKDAIGVDAQIESLCKVIDLRPNIKFCNGVFPRKAELAEMKKAGVYQGVLVLFDNLDSATTDLKEIIRLRPLLEFTNGRIPSNERASQIIHDRCYDGYLITFKRLDKDEKVFVYGKG